LLRTQRLLSDARRNVRLYTTIKDRKSPLKGSRPSVPHRTNFFLEGTGGGYASAPTCVNHPKLLHSMSNGTGVIKEIRLKNFIPLIPPFKVTQGHPEPTRIDLSPMISY